MEQVKEESFKQFNPNEHLIQLKSKEGSKDYLPVAWRLVWFREKYPHGTIDTEVIAIDPNCEVEAEAFVWNAEKRRSEKVTKTGKGYACFRAIVTDGLGGRATGTKSENAVGFPDYIEKAETGAIGRALAALGFGTQFAPDLDEGEHRIVDAPVERKPQSNKPANTPARSTDENTTEQHIPTEKELKIAMKDAGYPSMYEAIKDLCVGTSKNARAIMEDFNNNGFNPDIVQFLYNRIETKKQEQPQQVS